VRKTVLLLLLLAAAVALACLGAVGLDGFSDGPWTT
jgi:hypothetical protein